MGDLGGLSIRRGTGLSCGSRRSEWSSRAERWSVLLRLCREQHPSPAAMTREASAFGRFCYDDVVGAAEGRWRL
jgi:hypothetical protein